MEGGCVVRDFITVSRPFQIVGVDVELPREQVCPGVPKWPMMFALSVQKSEHIVRTLLNEIIPCGKALLSDWGANLLFNV